MQSRPRVWIVNHNSDLTNYSQFLSIFWINFNKKHWARPSRIIQLAARFAPPLRLLQSPSPRGVTWTPKKKTWKAVSIFWFFVLIVSWSMSQDLEFGRAGAGSVSHMFGEVRTKLWSWFMSSGFGAILVYFYVTFSHFLNHFFRKISSINLTLCKVSLSHRLTKSRNILLLRMLYFYHTDSATFVPPHVSCAHKTLALSWSAKHYPMHVITPHDSSATYQTLLPKKKKRKSSDPCPPGLVRWSYESRVAM